MLTGPRTSSPPHAAEPAVTSSSPRRTRPHRRLVRALVASLAGVAAATASAPWEYRWILPLAIAAFVFQLHRAALRPALLLGFLFGLGYAIPLTAWMRAVGVDAWLLLTPAVAAYYGLAAGGIAIVSRLRWWPLWTACLWVIVETAMAEWPLGGFPWTRLAWATVDTPFALWLPWIGASGVSFLVALVGSTLAWMAHAGSVRRRAALVPAAALLLMGAFPYLIRPESLTPSWEAGLPTATIAAVQGDVPGAGNDVVAVHRQVTENHVRATEELAARIESGRMARPDFVLWPENSTAVDPFRDESIRESISRAVTAIGVPVLVGAIVDGPRPDAVLNQGIAWLPDGSTEERYTKRHPVPFGEYVPFRTQLAGLKIGRLDMIPRDMIAGTRTEPLNVAGTRVANLICFDVAFDDSVRAQVSNGAQLVTVQTSNATFTGTSQLQQQFAISQIRAIETGRTVVIASTNGISGVIAPDGAIRSQLEPRTTDIAVAEVPLVARHTFAVRYGPWIQLALCIVGVAALMKASTATLLRRREEGHGDEGSGPLSTVPRA
ncbi:apolipoprotein N-acyltransferase [Nocardioides sp. SOB77]|uniref:Apolipoprotein N-acyltransferase n=1 Tax=Nocardioides oceani TaxID=3058369 RepID=A0ABT8FM06_9ACTN|nr:apolipoprotein N-acyltransferase [Nocardioides oceani]MDN4175702.1 apolipoprotein N-acyltransferase [Nocardioides oceani]